METQNETTETLYLLDKTIAYLTKQRENLLLTVSIFERLTKGVWIIQNKSNTYFQVGLIDLTTNSVVLHRPNGQITATKKAINEQFRLADRMEIEQHIQFLFAKEQRKLNAQLPEFYMITIKGENGTKVRHESFEVAVKEATRLAEVTQSRAHIMSVKAIVEPTIVQEPKMEYKLISL